MVRLCWNREAAEQVAREAVARILEAVVIALRNASTEGENRKVKTHLCLSHYRTPPANISESVVLLPTTTAARWGAWVPREQRAKDNCSLGSW